jgi:hypothetical protein
MLQFFKKVYGHCNVPEGYMVGGFKLGGWVVTQRKEYMKHRLGIPSVIINNKRVARLDRVSFDWYIRQPSFSFEYSQKTRQFAGLTI